MLVYFIMFFPPEKKSVKRDVNSQKDGNLVTTRWFEIFFGIFMSQNLGGNDSSNWMSICLKWIEVTNSSIVVFVGKNAGNNICSKTFFLRKKKAAAKGNKDMFLFRWRKFRQFEVLQKKRGSLWEKESMTIFVGAFF